MICHTALPLSHFVVTCVVSPQVAKQLIVHGGAKGFVSPPLGSTICSRRRSLKNLTSSSVRHCRARARPSKPLLSASLSLSTSVSANYTESCCKSFVSASRGGGGTPELAPTSPVGPWPAPRPGAPLEPGGKRRACSLLGEQQSVGDSATGDSTAQRFQWASCAAAPCSRCALLLAQRKLQT